MIHTNGIENLRELIREQNDQIKELREALERISDILGEEEYNDPPSRIAKICENALKATSQ